MKYYRYIWIIFLALICVNCKKDEEVQLTFLTIKSTDIVPYYYSSDICLNVSTNATITDLILEYASDASFKEYKQEKMTQTGKTGNQYQVTLSNLSDSTKYYIRCRATNKYSSYTPDYSNSFVTKTKTTPVVGAVTFSNISYTTATCQGVVTDNGGQAITSRGVCYATTPNPTISNKKVTGINQKDTFTCNLNNLTENTTYYVRAYITYNKGTVYGEVGTFTTGTYGAPTVTTTAASNITQTTATCGGNVTNDGGQTVTARGVCYSTTSNPTISNSQVASGTGTGSFTCNLTGLKDGTKYYVRAYATNSKGTAYGSQVIFTTTTPSTITYTASAKLTETTATYSSGLHTNAFNVSIASHTFSNGTGTIIFNGTMTSIGNYAFYNCNGLTSVTIPNSVTSIGRYAFYECFRLTSVTIPNSVTSIGYSAFQGCSSLTSVTIPNSVTSIGDDAFYDCSGLTSVTIPNSVTSIGEGTFNSCTKLTSISVASGNSYYSSSNGVLFNYNKTTLIQYPGGKSGSYSIPNSVTSIGDYAFSYCSGLTSVTIPNSVTSIGSSAFGNCRGLTSISVASGNSYYSSSNGVLFNYNKTTLIQYPGGKSGSYSIPNSVTSIGNNAFWNCTGLTSVTIPNSVTSIKGMAFWGCSGLTSITIPNSVTSIGNWAFEYCSGLTSITCNATTPPTCSSYSFSGVTKSIPVYVPASSVNAYKSATGWSDFTNYKSFY